MTQQKQEEQKPNVVFVGKKRVWDEKKQSYVQVPRDVPAYVQHVREKITLPEGVTPNKPFFSEKADLLFNASRDFLPANSADQPETDLPHNFPMREVLRGLGLQLADVKKLVEEKTLIETPGIGKKSVENIENYLKENNQENE